MTGSPVVRGTNRTSADLVSESGLELLDVIEDHPSKGSKSYYRPWLSNYLQQLQLGILELSRVVQPESPIAMVVQDSHYKEKLIDLQQIVIEVMGGANRSLTFRLDYPAIQLLSKSNPRARKHLTNRANSESLLVFA